MAIEYARWGDAGVFVGDHGQVVDRLALDIVADFEKLRNGVAAPVVDENLAGAHYDGSGSEIGKSVCVFFLKMFLVNE